MVEYKLISLALILIISNFLLSSILLMTKRDFQMYIQKWLKQSAMFLYISTNLSKGGGIL